MLHRKKMKKTKSMDDLNFEIPPVLTRKPAGMKVSDFRVSFVKIFLEDGSYKTLCYSSTTTIKSLINKIKDKDKIHLACKGGQFKMQFRYNSGKMHLAADEELVSSLVDGGGIEKIFLVSSFTTASPAKGSRKSLLKTVSYQYLGTPQQTLEFSNSGKVRTKKIPLLPNAKRLWESDTNLATITPQDLTVDANKDDEYSSSSLHNFAASQKRLHRRDRKKSLSTGNLSSLFSRVQTPAAVTMGSMSTLNMVEDMESSFSLLLRKELISESTESLSLNIEALPSYLSANRSNPTGYLAPTVPERKSACFNNCTISDSYLIQRAKHLNELMLNSQPTNHPSTAASIAGNSGSASKSMAKANVLPEDEVVYDIPYALKRDDTMELSDKTSPSNCERSDIQQGKADSEVHTYQSPRSVGINADTLQIPKIVDDNKLCHIYQSPRTATYQVPRPVLVLYQSSKSVISAKEDRKSPKEIEHVYKSPKPMQSISEEVNHIYQLPATIYAEKTPQYQSFKTEQLRQPPLPNMPTPHPPIHLKVSTGSSSPMVGKPDMFCAPHHDKNKTRK